MHEDLSPSAARAVAWSRRYAAARPAESVAPADLLVGLMAEAESHAGSMLRDLGVDFAALLTELNLGSDPDELVDSALPLGTEAAAIVGKARQLAGIYRRHEPAGSEELLAALLEVWDGADALFAKFQLDAHGLLAEYHRVRQPQSLSVDLNDLDLRVGEPLERGAVARIVDANANRAREAIRVVEDYARFTLDDGLSAGRLKCIRHAIREAIEFVSPWELLSARDTAHDVGTSIDAADEHSRRDLRAVVAANCKRAQEALRTLEECAKIESAPAARQFERLRYELYTIEKMLISVGRARQRLDGVVLYWLADPDACVHGFEWTVRQAIAGGVQVVQLRNKSSNDRELLALARQMRRWTADAGVLLVMNDRPDIARLAAADGVHVGQDELSVKDARAIVGPDALIGVSTHDVEQARAAVTDGADYIGVGPVFASRTKQFGILAGLEFVRQASAELSLPAFCIGGIDATNIAEVLAAGGRRIAVSAALNQADDPQSAASTLREFMEKG